MPGKKNSGKTRNRSLSEESEVKEHREVEVKESETRPPRKASSSSSSNTGSQGGRKGEIFEGRWDRTIELLSDKKNKWKRRLDSIARLIEGTSICAAIAIEGNSFLIATNTNFTVDSVSQGNALIEIVMSFLQKVAKDEYKEDEFKTEFEETFKKICREAISGLKLPAYIRDELLEGKFIASVMNSNKTGDFGELRDYISECIEYGHSPASQGAAFVVCVALLKDFQKVVKFIQNNRDEADALQAETRLFIKAIKNYKRENIIDREKLASKILNPDARDKMHAEMRVLALIGDQLNKKKAPLAYSNYIGISKLCCLACHAMIYAVNHAVDYGNSIEIRGAHNVDHSGAWHAPFNITGNPSAGLEPPVTARRSISSKTTDSFETTVTINFNAILKVKTDKKLTGSEGVSEYADYSQTSEEERDN